VQTLSTWYYPYIKHPLGGIKKKSPEWRFFDSREPHPPHHRLGCLLNNQSVLQD
jgi:hypothetical protein